MAKDEKKLQSFNSFNSGEYSPSLAGRVDLESFGSSTRYMSNMMSQVSGGVKKFYGTKHIAEIIPDKGRSNVKLVPFINRFEPMSLVFWGVDNPVEDEGGSIKIGLLYGDKYKDLDLQFPSSVDVQEMKWKQINDVIIFVHETVQPMAIKFYGKNEYGEYLFGSEVISFVDVPYFPIGATDDYVGTLEADGISGKVTITLPEDATLVRSYIPDLMSKQSSYTRKKTYSGSSLATYLAVQGTTVNNSVVYLFRVRNGIETILCSGVCNAVERTGTTVTDVITTEKILQVIKVKYPDSYIQNGFVYLPAIDDHETGDAYYVSLSVGSIYTADASTGEIIDEWYPSQVYTSPQYLPEITTFSDLGAKDWIGRKIKFYISSTTVVSPWWQGKDVAVGDYSFSNGHWYKSETAGKCGNIQPSHTYGVRTDGGVNWLYVHSGSTTASVIEVSDSSISVLVNGPELPANKYDDKYVFENYAWSIWGHNHTHPSEVYMVGNRLGFVCNTEGYGAWNSLSVVDDYFNFSTEEFGTQRDTSAIVHLIPNNESGVIGWVLSRNSVYMGSYSGEFHIAAPNGVLTPVATRVDNISNIGGKPVMPLKYKELNLFVGSSGKELYNIGYDYTIDDYVPQSLGFTTEHIMDKGIRRIEALNNKDRNVYLLHDSKEVSLFHYVKEQRVLGFSQLTFGSPVLDFVTTYSKEENAAYVAIQRNEGKVTFERFLTEAPSYMWDCVDFESPDEKFIPVLHHANKTVWIKFGEDLSQFKRVTLDSEGNTTEIPDSPRYQVGLPMVCELHTQPAFGNKAEGMQQQSIAVYLRLNKSGAFYYGSSVDFDKYFEYSGWPDRQGFEEGRVLYTGDCALNIPLGYAKADNQGDGKYPNTSAVGINIKSDTPEPFNLLSIQEIYK